MPNRLANETSPYLLQHKDNPVDWYPWGSEAFERAKAEDKPVMLSIGYSACHWCHVMAHESFEDRAIANLMNELFVNIKVDREERPDVDAIYMAATQAMTGHGGWPMTVFMDPDGRPFYTGTYFPSEDRGGMPAFPRVLQAVAEAYQSRRGDLITSSSRVIGAIQAQSAPRQSEAPLTRDLFDQAYQALASEFDPTNGGFGMQPKFPQPMTYEFLLRHWHTSGSQQALDMVTLTLEKMARGGIYDQVGGGFHRYSVDTYWLVPHFEKMLYDNALLPVLYLHGWQATGNPLFRQVAGETLDYILREMTHSDGGFYSATDADSEGEEGRFFVWLPSEIDDVVGPETGRIARAYWGVTREGNFEGKNILNVPRDADEVAADLGISVDQLMETVSAAKVALYDARAKRVPPGTDDKIITAWNAMTLKALAECGAAMGNTGWVEAARRNAGFLLENLVSDGRLLRTWKASPEGGQAKLKGYLEDYAFLVDGLVSLYEATFERRWLDEAIGLADRMVDLFWSDDDGVFFDTGTDHEQLVVRPRDVFDNASPCGGSAAAMALLRLSVFTANVDHQRRAVSSLGSVTDLMARAPSGFAWWLCALDFELASTEEVVIIGQPDDPATRALLEVARGGFAPHRVLAGAPAPVDGDASPLLEGRGLLAGRPTAYVCENYACQAPVTEAAELAAQLS
ncbi:MAG: thioredoxin domain-containing protein [Dehalococcoidia bacterium]